MTKYYVDTSIWRDLHENRRDNLRPLGEWAFELFRMIRINKDILLYSNFVIEELRTYYSQTEVDRILRINTNEITLEKIEITKKHTAEAYFLCKTFKLPFGDCLHAAIAKDSSAVLVTRDHHFDPLQSVIEIRKPEELI